MKFRIREHREKKGLTQVQLAELVGVVKSHISEIEKGKKNPSSPLMSRLSNVLGVAPSELIDDEGASTPKTKLLLSVDLLPSGDVHVVQQMVDLLIAKASGQQDPE